MPSDEFEVNPFAPLDEVGGDTFDTGTLELGSNEFNTPALPSRSDANPFAPSVTPSTPAPVQQQQAPPVAPEERRVQLAREKMDEAEPRESRISDWIATPSTAVEYLQAGKQDVVDMKDFAGFNFAGNTKDAEAYFSSLEPEELEQAHTRFAQTFYNVARMLPYMWEGGKWEVAGGLIGAALGSLGGGAGAAAGWKGGRMLSSPLAVGSMYRLGVGEITMDLMREGIETDLSFKAARFGAIPYALVELAQLDELMPGSGPAVNRLAHASVIKTIKSMGAAHLKRTLAESAEEGLQEIIKVVTANIAKDIAPELGLDSKSLAETLNAGIEEFLGTLPEMALIGLPATMVEGATARKRLKTEEKDKSDKDTPAGNVDTSPNMADLNRSTEELLADSAKPGNVTARKLAFDSDKGSEPALKGATIVEQGDPALKGRSPLQGAFWSLIQAYQAKINPGKPAVLVKGTKNLNGLNAKNGIYFDVEDPSTWMMQTFLHEGLSHELYKAAKDQSARDKVPFEATKIGGMLNEVIGFISDKEAYQEKLNDIKALYPDYTSADQVEEFRAKLFESFAMDKEFHRDLLETNPTLFKRLWDSVSDFFEKFFDTMSEMDAMSTKKQLTSRDGKIVVRSAAYSKDDIKKLFGGNFAKMRQSMIGASKTWIAENAANTANESTAAAERVAGSMDSRKGVFETDDDWRRKTATIANYKWIDENLRDRELLEDAVAVRGDDGILELYVPLGETRVAGVSDWATESRSGAVKLAEYLGSKEGFEDARVIISEDKTEAKYKVAWGEDISGLDLNDSDVKQGFRTEKDEQDVNPFEPTDWTQEQDEDDYSKMTERYGMDESKFKMRDSILLEGEKAPMQTISTRATLERIAKQGPKHYAVLAEELLGRRELENLPGIDLVLDASPGATGMYSYTEAGSRVEIKVLSAENMINTTTRERRNNASDGGITGAWNEQELQLAVLHELWHNVLIRPQVMYENGYRLLMDDQQVDALDDIADIQISLQERGGKKINEAYGVNDDIFEFMLGVLLDKRIQTKLASMESTNSKMADMWKEFIDAVHRFIGVASTKRRSLLNQAVEDIHALIQQEPNLSNKEKENDIFRSGRVISMESRNPFPESRIREKLYHGTLAEGAFGDFNTEAKNQFGAHFGPIGIAESFSEPNAVDKKSAARMAPVYLNMKNPARVMADPGDWASPVDVGLLLEKGGFIRRDQWTSGIPKGLNETDVSAVMLKWDSGRKYNVPTIAELRDILEDNGYDGVIYKNTIDATNKMLSSIKSGQASESSIYSYIVFHPEQISSATSPSSGMYSRKYPSRANKLTKTDWLINEAANYGINLQINQNLPTDSVDFLGRVYSNEKFKGVKADIADEFAKRGKIPADWRDIEFGKKVVVAAAPPVKPKKVKAVKVKAAKKPHPATIPIEKGSLWAYKIEKSPDGNRRYIFAKVKDVQRRESGFDATPEEDTKRVYKGRRRRFDQGQGWELADEPVRPIETTEADEQWANSKLLSSTGDNNIDNYFDFLDRESATAGEKPAEQYHKAKAARLNREDAKQQAHHYLLQKWMRSKTSEDLSDEKVRKKLLKWHFDPTEKEGVYKPKPYLLMETEMAPGKRPSMKSLLMRALTIQGAAKHVKNIPETQLRTSYNTDKQRVVIGKAPQIKGFTPMEVDDVAEEIAEESDAEQDDTIAAYKSGQETSIEEDDLSTDDPYADGIRSWFDENIPEGKISDADKSDISKRFVAAHADGTFGDTKVDLDYAVTIFVNLMKSKRRSLSSRKSNYQEKYKYRGPTSALDHPGVLEDVQNKVRTASDEESRKRAATWAGVDSIDNIPDKDVDSILARYRRLHAPMPPHYQMVGLSLIDKLSAAGRNEDAAIVAAKIYTSKRKAAQSLRTKDTDQASEDTALMQSLLDEENWKSVAGTRTKAELQERAASSLNKQLLLGLSKYYVRKGMTETEAAKAAGKTLSAIYSDLGNPMESPGIDVSDHNVRMAYIREFSLSTAGTKDKVMEWWKSMGLLSAPSTLLQNPISNFSRIVYEMGPKGFFQAAAATLGGDKLAFFKYGDQIRTMLSMDVWHKAAHDAVVAWKTEMPMLTKGRFGQKADPGTHHYALKGKFGRFARFPYRALTAGDEYFKRLIFEAHITAAARESLVYRGAKVTRKSMLEEANSIKKDPTSTGFTSALDRALEWSWQNKPIDLGMGIIKLRQSVPGAEFVIPFVVTPMNILTQGLRMSPLGVINLAVTGAKGEYKGDARRLASDIGEQAFAWGVTGLIYALAFGGDDDDDKGRIPNITGGPSSQMITKSTGKGFFERQENMKPMTIRLPNGKMFDYSRVEPLSTFLPPIIDGLNAMRSAQKGEGALRATAEAWGKTMLAMQDKTFMGSLADLVRAFDDPSSMPQWIGRFATAFFVPSIARSAMRALDDKERDMTTKGEEWTEEWMSNTMQKMMFSGTPLRGEGSPPYPKVDIFGRDIVKAGNEAQSTIWPRLLEFSGYKVKLQAQSKIARMLQQWNDIERYKYRDDDGRVEKEFYFSKPRRSLPIGKKTRSGSRLSVALNDEEYYRYTKIMGNSFSNLLTRYSFNVDNPTRRDIRVLRTFKSRASKIAMNDFKRRKR